MVQDNKKMIREMHEMFKGLHKSPEELQFHQLGMNLLNKNEFEKAEKAFNLAIKSNPQFFFSNYYLGRTLQRLGKYKEAIPIFSQAIQLNPIHAASHAYLGISFFRESQIIEAEEHFRRALENEPDNLTALIGLSKLIRRRQGKCDKTAELLKKSFWQGQMHPSLLVEILSLQKPDGEFFHRVGDEFAARGDCNSAVFFYRITSREDMENTIIHSKISDLRDKIYSSKKLY